MYRYISGQTFTHLGINDNPTTYDNHRYPGLHFTDLKVEKGFMFLESKIRAYTLVENLFNAKTLNLWGIQVLIQM